MIRKIAHLGVAVKDLGPVKRLYSELLRLPVSNEEENEEMRWVFVPVGESSMEFLQAKGEDGPIARFIHKNGEGIHHVALEVDDIEATLHWLKASGLPLVDETPRPGAHGSRIAFIHPKATQGVLLELVEPARDVEEVGAS